MKIIFAYVDVLARLWPPAQFREVFRKLPNCEVIECNDFESIKRHAEGTDVFIAAGTAMLPLSREQQHELMALFSGKALIMNTSLDPWESKQPYYSDMPWDFTTCFSKEKWTELRPYETHWLPNACDVRDYDCERDIDILVWGFVMYKYPFRMFIKDKLTPLLEGNGEKLDECLTTYPIRIGDKRYKYAILERGAKYYSEELYKLISRTRICPTGPTGYRIPLGKYVENAACGAVTMTVDFSDREELGFRHKQNIWLTNEESFLGDLQYLLENPNIVDQMGCKAKELVRNKHTTTIRAQEFYRCLCQKKGIDIGESPKGNSP